MSGAQMSAESRLKARQRMMALREDPAVVAERRNGCATKDGCWTDETVAQLKKLALENLSARDIAARLGAGHTRGAVLGKLFRLRAQGFACPAQGVRQPPPSNPDRPKRRPKQEPVTLAPSASLSGVPPARRGRDNSKAPVHAAPAARPAPEPVANGARISLLQLTSQTCKWPLGDPQHKDFGFCGQRPRANSPYCEYHARAACQPRQQGAAAC